MFQVSPYNFGIQQPIIPQPIIPQPVVPQPIASGGIKYVQSPESADAFNLAPNTSDILFNQNVDEFYYVSADASGTKTRRDFVFKEKEKASAPEYVTKDEMNSLKADLIKMIGDVKNEQPNE